MSADLGEVAASQSPWHRRHYERAWHVLGLVFQFLARAAELHEVARACSFGFLIGVLLGISIVSAGCRRAADLLLCLQTSLRGLSRFLGMLGALLDIGLAAG